MENNQEQNKGEKLDVAIAEMTTILSDLGDMFQRVKKIKYNYLIQTCDIYTRVDYPSIMMDVCDKEIKQSVPTAESIRRVNY